MYLWNSYVVWKNKYDQCKTKRHGKTWYKKDKKTYASVNKIGTGKVFFFLSDHHGRDIICLKKRSTLKIPNIYRAKDINVDDLLMNNDEVVKHVQEIREKYAQEVMILFHPFREESDLIFIIDKTY